MKVCSRCHIEKSISKFYKNKATIDGYQYSCKECEKEYSREYQKKNKDVVRKKQQKYWNKNREDLNKLRRERYSLGVI